MAEISEILARSYGEDDGDRHALHLTYLAYAVAAILFAILIEMARSMS